MPGSGEVFEMISALDVKGEFKERLQAAGLWDKLDLRESQFLDLPPQVFVELVTYDAGIADKLADVAGDVQLSHPDEEMDIVIRAHWQITSIRYAGQAVGLSGGVRAAERFEVLISSGSASQRVVVDVTKDAIDLLKSRMSATAVDPRAHRQIVTELVQKFVEMHLSQGGTSYWDPIRVSQLDLNAAAVQYMIGHQLFFIGSGEDASGSGGKGAESRRE